MEYVGKTKNTIRTRFNGHRGNIRNHTEAFAMFEHFCGVNGHGIRNMVIKPIEICTKDNINKREKHWIGELNTVFPYGLNMDASFKGIKNAYDHTINMKSGVTIYSIFNVIKNTRSCKGGDNNSVGNDSNFNFNPEIWIKETIEEAAKTNNMIHFLRTEIYKLKKDNLKLLFLDNAKKIHLGEVYINLQHPYIHYVIRDLCLHKLQKIIKKPHTAFIVINHINKLVDLLNIPRMLNQLEVKSLFPVKSNYYSGPSVSFTYTKTIKSSIVNYVDAVSDPNFTDFVCNCHNYPDKYIDSHHGHIYTGDIDLVKQDDLRFLLSKGLGYHEQQPPNKDKAFKAIISGVDAYIDSVSRKTGTSIQCFTAWKSVLIKKVKSKLNKSKTYRYNNILNKAAVKEELAKLQRDFVFIPVDKAANNVSIICKKYYIEVISNEIEQSSTFEHISNDKVQFLNTVLPSLVGNRKLPYLYATAKMHKSPKKFRYITAARDTAFSDISIAVSKCLKLLLKTASTSFGYQIKEIDNSIFVIDNRNKVIECLDKSNSSKDKHKCISTWDFSTLYTNIPHDKLKDKLSIFINRMFAEISKSKKAAEFICCSNKSDSAYFSKSMSKVNKSFNSVELIKAVNIVIDNSYIIYHDSIYRQKVGIPMGTNCAPFLANIFLHVYEYEYMQKLVSQGDTDIAKKLSSVYRYQDDCVAINDEGIFRQHHLNIYPPEMILETTNISTNVCTFLDLRISIFRGKFKFSSYDKRRDFNFEISNYPNLKGNIPRGGSYGVYVSQLVRFCDINDSVNPFINDVKCMTSKFINQGFAKQKLSDMYLSFSVKYWFKWTKFGVDITSFHHNIFD